MLRRREIDGLKAVAARGVSLVSPADQLCREDVCPASEDSASLYLDTGHLSADGSRRIGEHASALKLPPAPL